MNESETQAIEKIEILGTHGRYQYDAYINGKRGGSGRAIYAEAEQLPDGKKELPPGVALKIHLHTNSATAENSNSQARTGFCSPTLEYTYLELLHSKWSAEQVKAGKLEARCPLIPDIYELIDETINNVPTEVLVMEWLDGCLAHYASWYRGRAEATLC